MAIYKNTRSATHLDRTYIGVVKVVEDAKYAGRVRVWIPEFEAREEDESGWIICNYCSPFGGVTNREKNSRSHFDLFDKTQTAYGMWMIPPDINNEVLVVFPSGDINRALWVGSVFKEYMNHSIPEAAYSENSKQFFGEGKKVPVTEYNKWDKTGDSSDPINPVRPYQETRFNGISEQGLIADEIRGITTSSSMRETPSQVFGINTPGPANPKTDGARQGGHSFVMDDGDEDGNDSYIGFKTKSGATIRIDETNGIIYAINKKGTGWIQMDADGNVDIFGAESISMRTQKDFNLRADGNINMEAGKNVNIKAAQDTDAEGKIVGEGDGEGGDIFVQAVNNMHTTVDDNAFFTVTNGNLDIDVQTGNKLEHVTGNLDNRIDGNQQDTIGGTLGIKSSNYQLDSGGNIDTEGEIISSGNMYAPDFKTPSHGLNGHQHIYTQPKHGAGPTSTSKDGGGGGGSSASGPDAAQATPAELIPKMPAVNVLLEFDGTVAMNLNNDNVSASDSSSTVEIPDYWNRKTEDVESIVARLMTYEPCPAHINKGGQT